MDIFEIIFETIMEFLQTGHPAVIHFPIIGILMGFTAGGTALAIRIVADFLNMKPRITILTYEMFMRYVERFEFTSLILTILGIFGYGIAGITGFFSAGGVEPAINNTLLEFKVRLSMIAVLILFIPVFLKIYVGVVYKKHLFTTESYIPGIMYLIPLVIAAPLTAIVAGAGGVYVYGHSILQTFGLGWILPVP